MAHTSKIYGSLVKRTLGILVALVIIPLSIDAFLLERRNEKIRLSAARSQLKLMEESFAITLSSFLIESHLLLQGPLTPVAGTAQYQFDAHLICTGSTIEAMVGRGEFFPIQLNISSQVGWRTFIGFNPYTGVDELFVFQKQGHILRGLSISQALFLKRLDPLQSFTFDLVNRKVPTGGPLTAIRSYPNSNFCLRVTTSPTAIAQLEGTNVYHHFFVLMGIFLIVGGLGTLWLLLKMSRPLNQLSKVMEGVSNQDVTLRYRPDPFGFEINSLGQRFNSMLDSLLRHMEEVKNERSQREKLSRELEIGHNIQLQLLPQELPAVSGVTIATRFAPAQEVAGDFYDLCPQSASTLFFSIADASDKGISACLYSLIARSLLRALVQSGEPLCEAVRRANNLLCRDTGNSGNFVTAWLGLLNTQSGDLTYTSAGHLPTIWIDPSGTLQELTTGGIALGAVELGAVEIQTIALPKGSQLFLYTDGLLDAQTPQGELFGKERLFKYLQASWDREPESLVAGLLEEVQTFTLGSEPYDDLTLLNIKLS